MAECEQNKERKAFLGTVGKSMIEQVPIEQVSESSLCL